MQRSLDSSETKILQTCWNLMRQMTPPFAEKDLFQISALLKTFEASDLFELKKISEIPDHLHPQMEPRHLHNWLIPIERLLGKSLRDDEFLITSVDHSQPKVKLSTTQACLFILDNLRSAFNVGSIFRLADCVGHAQVWCTGYTLTPESEQLQKTSMGAHQSVPWRAFSNIQSAMNEAKQAGYNVIALETAQKATPLWKSSFPVKTAFVVGNERFGLEASTLENCDEIVQIPTRGTKNSLNVAQALAIASYEWQRQHDGP